jgi:hypothetical protein
MEDKKIDWSQYRRIAGNEEVARHKGMPQSEREKHPTYFERKTEQEGRSNFSGGVFGGRVDRSR